MTNGIPVWAIHAVDGALIGDRRTALADLAAGKGFNSLLGGIEPGLWAPNYETPMTGDSLYPITAKGFGIAQDYATAADGHALAGVDIYGDNPPDPAISLLIKVRREFVSGAFAQEAASVSAGVIAFGPAGGSAGTNLFVGRIISKLANPMGSTTPVPIQDFTVTADDITAGNFTVTPDPVAAGCRTGDLFTLRSGRAAGTSAIAGDLTFDATSYTDPLFNNLYNSAGLTVNGNIAQKRRAGRHRMGKKNS